MKILLTGINGQVGHALANELSSLGEVIPVGRMQMDLADPDQVRDTIRRVKPALIINPAAYTAVDKAESEPALAFSINAECPAIMAQEAERLGAGLIHFSTDYVFDGSASAPYTEHDSTHPLSVYGASKLAGEESIARHCEAHWIFRTSWVYGTHGNNFLKTIMRLALERTQLNIVGDQIGGPTSTTLISDTVTTIVRNAVHGRQPVADAMRAGSGVYHLTAAGATSWHAYALFIIEKMRALRQPVTVDPGNIAAIASADYPTAAVRPLNSLLSTQKLAETFGIKPAPWQLDVELVLTTLITGKHSTGA
jgi:dTDP-4-dehydrorhamnose reductase